MTVVDRDLGFAQAVTRLKQLGGKTVKIGIQGDADEAYENGVGVIDVAVFNEFGTAHIPSRPFIRQCFALHSEEATRRIAAAVAFIERGGEVDLALGQVGQWYEGKMKHVLTTYPWKPNSPATIRRKKSTKPLLDTGQLRNAIRYKVE